MNKLTQSDKKIGTFLSVSAAVAYDKKNKVRTESQIKLIKEAMFVFRQIMNLPDGLSVRLAHIKKKNRFGTYYNTMKIAEVEARRNDLMDVLRTMAHELVHAEQYHTGRLKSEWVPRTGYVQQWYGEVVKNKGATYNSYRKQPWEQEAFDRQEKLARFVASVVKDML